MSLIINDKLEVKFGSTCVDSEVKLNGEHIPYTSKVELITDCSEQEITQLIITVACVKIENNNSEQKYHGGKGMRLHPELVLKHDPRSDKDRQFVLYVMKDNEHLGGYYFKSLDEAMRFYPLAWNVFNSTCSFYNSLSETKIEETE